MTTRPAKSSVKTTNARKPVIKSPPATATRRKSASASAQAAQGADVPILPVDQLERLHAIKPDAVDWVIRQTQLEAEHRREETSRVNGFILLENLFGQFAALIIGATGILGGSWVAVNGQPWAGVAIGASVITGLTFVFLAGRKKRQ